MSNVLNYAIITISFKYNTKYLLTSFTPLVFENTMQFCLVK